MPGKLAARVTDLTTHGSPLFPGPGSPDTLIGGLPAWRTIVDQHACPAASISGADGVGFVIVGSPTVLINTQMACRIQDIVVEKPGSAMGPVNPIAMGCPTVLIGESGFSESGMPKIRTTAIPGMTLESADEAIAVALKNQREMLARKKTELAKWDVVAQVNFKKWFGTADDTARRIIQDRIDKMLDLNGKLKPENFRKADPEKLDRFAYVYPNDSSTIYLDQAFATAPATGQDSRPGTLAHEMSHFTSVGGTKDHIYGAENSKELATKEPAKALENADNFEYYLEEVN